MEEPARDVVMESTKEGIIFAVWDLAEDRMTEHSMKILILSSRR